MPDIDRRRPARNAVPGHEQKKRSSQRSKPENDNVAACPVLRLGKRNADTDNAGGLPACEESMGAARDRHMIMNSSEMHATCDAATLRDDLAARMKGCLHKARANYFFAYVLLAIAVASSVVASIGVASGLLAPAVAALLAAIPGVVLLTIGTFKFEARADWWYGKHHGLDALYRGLVFEGRTAADVSRDLTVLIRDLEKKWPTFGKASGGPDV